MLEQCFLTSCHASETRLSVSSLIPKFPPTATFSVNCWINPDIEIATESSKTMLVKRTLQTRPARHVNNEIEILRLIYCRPDIPNTLPTLLFHSDAFNEFGIIPCGYCPKPGNQMIPWVIVLTNILDALQWLHKHNIIHRDVRWDNVIWNIDLGCAARIDPSDRDEPKFM